MPSLDVQMSDEALASTGSAEHEVEERVDRGAIEVDEVDPTHTRSVPQRLERRRHGLRSADRRHEEHEVGVDELRDERRRRGVEEVQVVHEEHHRTCRREVAHHGADCRDDGDEVALVRDVRRQRVRERAERRVARAFGRGRPRDVAPLLIGEREALVRQPGLPHTRRTVDHEAVRTRVGEGAQERLELVVPAYERPLQRQHGHRREPYRATQSGVAEKLSNGCSGQRRRLRCPLAS